MTGRKGERDERRGVRREHGQDPGAQSLLGSTCPVDLAPVGDPEHEVAVGRSGVDDTVIFDPEPVESGELTG